MFNRRKLVLVALVLITIVTNSSARPKLRVAEDGFPSGHDTPEGAASDLARAFIAQDAAQFKSICIRAYGAGQARTEYMQYLEGVSDHLKQSEADPENPKKIVRVFAARHLTKNGPASYGYAAFDFQDVMFVDVEVMLHSGSKHLRRTMVIKDRDGKWYAHPVPDVSPLLSYGLSDESASIQLFTDAYDVTP